MFMAPVTMDYLRETLFLIGVSYSTNMNSE